MVLVVVVFRHDSTVPFRGVCVRPYGLSDMPHAARGARGIFCLMCRSEKGEGLEEGWLVVVQREK
mgnify:CR=1 FL=1